MSDQARATHCEVCGHQSAAVQAPASDQRGLVTAKLVRSILRARRLRDEALGRGLFPDPAWDMLLDLLATRLEGKLVSVSGLRLATPAPASTAHRWINVLQTRNLVERRKDASDRRRVYIALTEDAAARMIAVLEAGLRELSAASEGPGGLAVMD